MKFDEKDFETIDNKNLCLIYFLLLDDEVVYVGKTENGLSRPFQHKDKYFNCVKVKYVNYEQLDMAEDFYMKKYLPIYNKRLNMNVNFTKKIAFTRINKHHDFHNFTMKKFNNIINSLRIEYFQFQGCVYLSYKDCALIEQEVIRMKKAGELF